MLRALLDLLAPVRCLSCRRRGDQPWCRDCAPDPLDVTSTCRRCGAPVERPVPVDGGRACPLADSAVAETVAAHAYRGAVAAAVRTAKLSGGTAAYPALADQVAAVVQRRGLPPPDVVTGVPVPAARRRRRGFDHAALLASGVAERLDRRAASLLVVVRAGADRGASLGDTRVSTMVARTGVPDEVLLVDDVVTTGATVREAAAALRDGGARRVRVAVVARAGGHDPRWPPSRTRSRS